MNHLERLGRRILLAVGRGRVQLGDDSGPVQTLQVVFSELETQSELKRLVEFGVASMPPAGSDCVAVFIGGDRSNGVIIATGSQANRFKNLQPGEAALYNAFSMSIYLTENGIVVDGGTKPITINNAKGVTINSSEDVVLNMGGNNVSINDPGAVTLGPAGRAVVMDGDPVSGGVVHATQTVVTV